MAGFELRAEPRPLHCSLSCCSAWELVAAYSAIDTEHAEVHTEEMKSKDGKRATASGTTRDKQVVDTCSKAGRLW